MARKITMFELHFDGINLGGARGDASDRADEEYEMYDDEGDEYGESRRGFRGRRVLAVAGVFVLAAFIRSRVAGRVRARMNDDGDVVIEDVDSDEPEVVTVD